MAELILIALNVGCDTISNSVHYHQSIVQVVQALHIYLNLLQYVWCYSIVHGSSNVWCMEQLARMESK